MAKASVGYNYYKSEADVLCNDIWSQKARHRMSTARERKSITMTTPMSAEAAMAMQQLSKSSTNTTQIKCLPGKNKQGTRRVVSKKKGDTDRVQEARHVCTVKLSDVYEKLGAEQKLDGDITDPNTWDESATKFVLGGGKLQNAMEIVEIVNADIPKPQASAQVEEVDEEHAIAEIARINSINKCNVWFEAHESLLEQQDKADNEDHQRDNNSKYKDK